MSRSDKLFRAIVIMGAAITAPACDSGRPKPVARKDAPVVVSDASTPVDAAADAAVEAPADAPSDARVDAGRKHAPPDVMVERVLIL